MAKLVTKIQLQVGPLIVPLYDKGWKGVIMVELAIEIWLHVRQGLRLYASGLCLAYNQICSQARL
jgi:hypothetical protein